MRPTSNAVFTAIFSLLLSGCGALYTNIHLPRAYRTATPNEVRSEKADPMVTGKACYQTVLFMVAWGDAGYAKATSNALKNESDAILYDVKADAQLRSVAFGLYTQACTIVTGKVAKQ